jgi:hypothetical protein
MIHLHRTFKKIQSYGHTSKEHLVQLMAVIFTLQPPHSFMTPAGTKNAFCLKTAYSSVLSTFFSHTLLLDGRDLLQMPEFMRMLLIQILAFQMDGIF